MAARPPQQSCTSLYVTRFVTAPASGCARALQVLTLLRGVYLHLLFMPALLSAPLCMGLGVGRDAWLLLMRWTLERAGPVRCLRLAPAPGFARLFAWGLC